MNKQLWFYASFMLISVFISSVSQVLLKKASMKEHGSFIREYLNPSVVFAYSIFVIATFLSIFAYRVVPLSMGGILESTSYIYVTIFGVTIFKEKFTKRKAVALALIISGIFVYSFFG